MQGRDHRPGRREGRGGGRGAGGRGRHRDGGSGTHRAAPRPPGGAAAGYRVWRPAGPSAQPPACGRRLWVGRGITLSRHQQSQPKAAQSRGRPGFLGPSDPCIVRGVGESEARGQARPEGSEPPNGLVASPAGPPGLVPSAAWRPSAGWSTPSSPRPRAPGTRVRQRENVCLGESRLVTLGEPTLGAWLVGDLRRLSLDPSLTSPPECPLPGAVRPWATFASLHP